MDFIHVMANKMSESFDYEFDIHLHEEQAVWILALISKTLREDNEAGATLRDSLGLDVQILTPYATQAEHRLVSECWTLGSKE